MSYGRQETIGRKLRRNYDLLLAAAGVAILPLMQPAGQYIVSMYSSTHSGIGEISVFLTAFALVMIGLVARICRHVFGSGIN